MVCAHPNSKLSREQLGELERRLLAERILVSRSLESLAGEASADPDCTILDVSDAAGFRQDRGRAVSLAMHQRDRLADVNAALERLEDGTYGVTKGTHEPIPYQRLLVLPWTRTNPQT